MASHRPYPRYYRRDCVCAGCPAGRDPRPDFQRRQNRRKLPDPGSGGDRGGNRPRLPHCLRPWRRPRQTLLPDQLRQDPEGAAEFPTAVGRPQRSTGTVRRLPCRQIDRGRDRRRPLHALEHSPAPTKRRAARPVPSLERANGRGFLRREISCMSTILSPETEGLLITDHAARTCRFCGARIERTFVDLGMSPLCETYPSGAELNHGEIYYPLHTYVCDSCFLVQLEEYEKAENIFSDYAYFSSFSDSWLRHAEKYCESMEARFKLDSSSFAVEVASNDGYL